MKSTGPLSPGAGGGAVDDRERVAGQRLDREHVDDVDREAGAFGGHGVFFGLV